MSKIRSKLYLMLVVILLMTSCAPAPIVESGAPQSNQPPALDGSIEVLVSSSNTKEDWMDEMAESFNSEGHRLASEELVFVRVTHVTSGGSQKAILDGTSQPVMWSPGDQSWIDGLNEVRRQRGESPLVTSVCPPSILAPIGFAMWRPMAEVLGWPNEEIGWDTLVELSANPQGWGSIGHPEWGQFKFGHTHPGYANSGMLSMLAFAYAEAGIISGLTVEQIYSDEVMDAFRNLELHTFHYGLQNRPLMQALVNNGPSYLHAITSSEAEVLKANAEYATTMSFPLVFIFPSAGTYWSEQPMCILTAPWVDAKETEGAELFRDYLAERPQQERAIDFYLRPVEGSIPLHPPFTLSNGTDPSVTRDSVPALESPSAEISDAVIDLFYITKKPATVIAIVDVSGSMEGAKIQAVRDSLRNYMSRLDRNDEIYIYVFGGFGVMELGQGGRVGDVIEELDQLVAGIVAGGGTPLYDAVCEAVTRSETLQSGDIAAGEARLYGIVLLSDGDDTASSLTFNRMKATCLPSTPEVGGTKIFAIAYGQDAMFDVLERIANATGGRTFTATPESLESIYNAISAEQ